MLKPLPARSCFSLDSLPQHSNANIISILALALLASLFNLNLDFFVKMVFASCVPTVLMFKGLSSR